MIRIFTFIGLFLLLHTIEVSLVHSLPFPLDRLPFMIAISAYALQYLGFTSATYWLVLHGLFLDLTQISFVPLETISYSMAGLVGLAAARHLFSNRSYYGVAATTAMCIVALTVMQILVLLIINLTGGVAIGIDTLMSVFFWELFLGALFLLILFPIAPYIRKILENLLLLPRV